MMFDDVKCRFIFKSNMRVNIYYVEDQKIDPNSDFLVPQSSSPYKTYKATQINDLVINEFSSLSGQSARPVFGRSWVPFLSGIFSMSNARVMLISSQICHC